MEHYFFYHLGVIDISFFDTLSFPRIRYFKVLRLKVALHSIDVEALVMEKKMRHTSLHTPSTIFSCTAEGCDLSDSVNFVIDLCRNYKRGGGNDSYASLWFAGLEKLISLKTIALGESHKGIEILVVRI